MADIAQERKLRAAAGQGADLRDADEIKPIPADDTHINGNDGGATPQDPEASRTKLETIIILASLCSVVFLAALDVSIITTALPTISEHFNSNEGYTWIGSAYLLANASSTPIWGKISDIWGRKPILLTAAMVFFFGSLLAGISVTVEMLIAARVLQGLGAGGILVLVNICIGDLFSMRKRGQYFGMIGMVWAIASAVGPLLGGVFTQQASWRWCFYINLPITAVVVVALFFFLHLEHPKITAWEGLKAVDWTGSLLIIGGTVMVLLGLTFGGVTFPWSSPTVIYLIVFGTFLLGLFVINEWKLARYPIMPLRLFNRGSNVAALGLCFSHGFVFVSASYYLPLYFQAVLGSNTVLSGVYLLPFMLSLSLVSASTGIVIKKTGKYLPPLYFGVTIMIVGFGLFVDLPRDGKWVKIITYQIVAGFGVGPNFQPPLLALQSMVQPSDMATATAMFGFMRNLSGSISVVVGGVVFQNEMQKKYELLLKALGNELAGKLSGQSAGASVGIVATLPEAQGVAARIAFYDSLRSMWIMYTAFAGLGLIVSLFVRKNVLSKEHGVTKLGIEEQQRLRKEREQGLEGGGGGEKKW